MWSFASNALAGAMGLKNDILKPSRGTPECSDDEVVGNSREEGLECPVCWESFNMVENVPHVLWCGHTLCKNCVLGLQRAVVKSPSLPIKLPFFISCPWCTLLSLRLVYKGNLKFPSKNYFLLWMIESMNGNRSKSHSSFRGDHQKVSAVNKKLSQGTEGSNINNRRNRNTHRVESSIVCNPSERHAFTSYMNTERLPSSLRKSFAVFVHFTSKFPLIVMFLAMTIYVLPATATILALYILITFLFAVPSFLVLYFALPSMDWLVREILT